MKLQKLPVILLISSFLFTITPQTAVAIEALSAKELAKHCAAYPKAIKNADAQFCVRYIQGFIDGAIATDAQVMLNVEADLERKETFAERALRTRSSKRSKQDRAAKYAEFCLGKPVELRSVVDKVATHLLERPQINKDISARAVVYGVLKKQYPCKGASIKKAAKK